MTMTLNVNEIFFSIQGESTYAGRPCVFVRLTGCNLRCGYCDTRYAYDEGERLSIDAIIEAVSAHGVPLVEITGGEPLLQPETPELIDRLLADGFEVLMETNGSFDIGRVNAACVKIVDIKCPASGESHTTDLTNLDRLGSRDEIKFVLSGRNDYEYARDLIREHETALAGHPVLMSTVAGVLSPAQLAQWILEDRLDVRLQLQLHKFIWPETMRGV